MQAVKDQAKQRQVNGTPLPHQRQRSSQLIGQMVGVSHATVERVDRLRRLSPEGFEEVVEGKAPLARPERQRIARGGGIDFGHAQIE